MKPLIIAHRGTSADAPENTLIAFEKAIEVGADGIEFDVQLSADNIPVVIHDKSLRRTGKIKRKVADLTAAELNQIDVGTWFDKKFAGQTVPLLSQILDLFADNQMLLYLELKCNKKNFTPLVKAVAELIKDSPVLERIIVLSFTHQALAEMKREIPNIKTGALFEPKPLSLLRIRRKFIQQALEFEADQIAPHCSIVTRKSVLSAKEQGFPTIAWTANKTKFLTKAISYGLYAVITNHAQVFLEKRDELLKYSNL